MGERRRRMNGAICALLLLFSLCNYGEKATALAGTVTVAVVNLTGEEVIPRLVDASSGTGVDYDAVPPNSSTKISFEAGKRISLFFATGCSRDQSGNLRNCSSGDCREGSCTVLDRPVATKANYNNGTWTLSVVHGYNFGLTGKFQCTGCDCGSPISCLIPLSKCPESLRMYEQPGSLVACRAGDGSPSDYPGSDPYLSASTSCLFKDVIFEIVVSSPQ